jgi:outer membrane protein OmpA-like peptidoglycan-associated protein
MTDNPIWIAGGLAAGLVSAFGMMSVLPKIEDGLEAKTQALIVKAGLDDRVRASASGQDISLELLSTPPGLGSNSDLGLELSALQKSLKSELKPLSPSLALLNEFAKGYWVRGPISHIAITSATSRPMANGQPPMADQGSKSSEQPKSVAPTQSTDLSSSKQSHSDNYQPNIATSVPQGRLKAIETCQNQLAQWLKTYPVTYDPAGFQLDRSARYRVKDLKAKFLTCGKDLKLHIIGHTDSIGDEETNQLVSLARAEALRNALVVEGLDSNLVSYEGKGETLPIASNATKKGRLQNRRTEIIITSLPGDQS